MGRETDEIVAKAKRRAAYLLDYLEFYQKNPMAVRRRVFAKWFYEETYSWYAVLVMEECLALLREEKYAVIKGELFLPCVMVMRDLYRRNGVEKRYFEFCLGIVDEYRKPELRRMLPEEWNPFLEHLSLEVAEYFFFEKKDYLTAPVYYEQYQSYGGSSAGVDRKYKYCISEGYVPKEVAFEPVSVTYITGRELDGSETQKPFFVGRDELIAQYAESLRSAKTGIRTFYGQFRIGKSSILEYLKSALEKEYYNVSISMDTVHSAEAFYDVMLKQLARYSENSSRYYREISKQRRQEGKRGLNAAEYEHYLEEICEILRADSGKDKKVLLFLDEFVAVMSEEEFLPLENFLQVLYTQVTAGRMQAVITGAEKMRDCIETYPAFFAKSMVEELKYLSYEATAQLLEEPTRMADRTGRYPNKTILRRVYELTKGQPFITQHFAQVIVNVLNQEQKNMVTREVLDAAVNQVLYRDKSIWTSYFNFLLDSQSASWTSEDVRKVCAKLQGKCEQGDITKAEFEASLDEVERNVFRNLLERDIIRRDVVDGRERLYVYLTLFGKWCHSWE